ncbi:TetR/AcrR family transcriptional regulator [Streptomyces sp. NPDC004051]
MTSHESSNQPLRADARRNRDLIVQAAREAFAEIGPGVSLNEVARRAEVSAATLLRRFPRRADLIAAVYADKICAYVEAMDAALAHPDPWEGFRSYLETAFELQASDRSFADVLTTSLPSAPEFAEERRRAARALPTLIERAQAAGRLRPDFVHQDVALLLLAVAGIANAVRDAAPQAWQRASAMIIDGLQVTTGTPLAEAPTATQIVRALTSERANPRWR